MTTFVETLVNTHTASNQSASSLTALADGGWVVTWVSDGQDGSSTGIYQQRYDKFGATVGVETRVNSHVASFQDLPSTTALADGGWLVAWESEGQDGDGIGIYQQRYNAAGVAVDDETLVNSTTVDNQHDVSVAAFADGGWVATWVSDGQDGDGAGVYMQRFDENGDPVGLETLVNSTVASDQYQPNVATMEDGRFAITWTSDLEDGDGTGIYVKVYYADGTTMAEPQLVNTTVTDNQSAPKVSAIFGGGWLVSWESANQDGSGSGIYGRILDGSGVFHTAGGLLNTTTTGNQTAVSIAALADHWGYVVVWVSANQDGDGYGIYQQRYDLSGLAYGSETLVTTYVTSDQTSPSVTALEDGGWVVNWTSLGQDGDGSGIYQQRFNAKGERRSMIDPTGQDLTVTLDEDTSYTFEPSDFGFSDSDGDAFASILITRLPDTGTLKLDGETVEAHARIAAGDLSKLVWTPEADDNGAGLDSLEFHVFDSYGSYAKTPNTITFDVTAVDDPGSHVNYVETQVNSYTTGDQSASSVTALADGGWVVTWQSYGQDGSGHGIYQQRYSADGAKNGAEMLVNSYKDNSQFIPSVAALEDGGWVVTWQSLRQDGSNYGIYQQRYSANGAKNGAEIQVNSYTEGSQLSAFVTGLEDGGWVVAWSSGGQDGSRDGIYQQRYSANGSKSGAEIQVNSYMTDAQSNASVTALDDGGWVVTWESFGQDGSGFGIYQQRYRANGAKNGTELLVNSYTAGDQQYASVTALEDGGWVVAWSSDRQDGSGYGIYQQRYNANGSKSGTEMLVNSYTTGAQSSASVTALEDGGWLVTWQSLVQDGSNWGIYQQRYSADGSKSGTEMLVNSFTTGDQQYASVTALEDGGWVVTWTSDGQDGSNGGVYQQRYSKDGTTVSATAPEAANATVSLDEDSSYQFSKDDFGFTDADGDKLESITITGLPSSGKLMLDGVAVEKNDVIAARDIHKLVWTPDANANGKGLDSLKFTVTDSYGSTSKASYAITFDVDAVDDLTVYAETRVNSYTASDQTASDITTLSDGSFVVTWQSGSQDGDGGGIYQQHYSSKGVKIGGEEQVNSYTVSQQLAPAITALSDGGWVVTWQSAGPDGSSYGIVQQRYDADGNADAAGETLVNTYATSTQRNSVVTALEDGGWVVAWESLQDGSLNIYQQRFSSNGNASDGEVLVNSYASDQQVAPTITALEDGGWVVAWEGSGGNGSEYGIYQQRYNSAGTAVGSESLVNSTTAGDQGAPSITALSDGGWVVTWYDPNKDGDAFGIFQQRYNSSGVTVGSETQVNTFVTGIQFESSVTALKSGGWVVTWSSSDHDGSQYGVYQQLYNKNGAKVGDETRINTTSAADQDMPSVSALNDGGWVVTWSSADQDGVGEGVYMQRFNSAGKTSFSSDPTGKNKTVTAKEDTDFSFAKSLITFSDNDGDTLSSIVITSLPTKGKLTFAGQAVQKNDVIAVADLDELVWTPPANANGKNVASIGFKVEDSSGNMSSSTYKLTMDVTAVNDAPTGAGKTLTIKEDSGYKMNKSAFGFADVDGDSLGSVKISTLDGDGTLTFKGKEVALGASIAAKDLGQLVWKPLKDAFGTGVGDIGFKVVDDNGLASSKINHLIFNVTDVVDTITGKKGADTLIGTAGADTISGLAGNDKLDGRAGNDSLAGGTGKDTFIFTGKLNDADKIVDFDVNGGDVIDLSASKIKNFSDLMTTYAHDSGSDVVISFEAGGKVVSSLTIEGVSVAELKVDDFLI